LAIVLIVIGGKIFAADLLGIEKIPPALSLAMIVSIIGAGVVFSLIWSRPDAKKATH
jgi:tellurite resistance protein TerC